MKKKNDTMQRACNVISDVPRSPIRFASSRSVYRRKTLSDVKKKDTEVAKIDSPLY
jgi:hypothetical protein